MKLGLNTSHLNLEVIIEDVSEEINQLNIKNIEVVDYQVIPPTAKKTIENYSRTNPANLEFDPYKIPEFLNSIIINHNNETKTIIAQESQENNNNQFEEVTYLINLDKDNNQIGNGEIRTIFNNKMQPQVASTNTTSNHRGKGLGTQRYKLMNFLSKVFYNKPLHSDNHIQPPARSIWERLVTQNQATSYVERGQLKYQFIE